MNNDNFNQNNDQDDQRPRRGQQSFPGRVPPQQTFPGRVPPPQQSFPGRFPPPQQSQGRDAQPRTAPPNFIPEGPGMERRQGEGPTEFGLQYRGGWQSRPRELRRCLYRFTYIWLDNGNNFWFYPIFVGGQFVQGFRWRRNRWEFDRINLRRIFFSRCY